MTYRGKVRNGMVILEDNAGLADGTVVRVEPVEAAGNSSSSLSSLGDRLNHLAGKAAGLPSDLARHHDHYLHGRPRR